MKSIVTISGTSRPNNYTSFALNVVREALQRQGAEVHHFDARELELSFPGEPTTTDAKRLQKAVVAADATIIATPEYHGTFAAMTKLIIENMGFPSALEGKPVSLMGVATGRIGAIKSLEQLRGVCAHVGAVVLPGAVSVAGVRKAFTEEGECINEEIEKILTSLAANTLEYIENYVCPRLIMEAQVRQSEEEDEPWSTSL